MPRDKLPSVDPVRNFHVPIEERVRALTIGPPAYAVRKRRIEDGVARIVEALVALAERHGRRGATEGEIEATLLDAAGRVDLTALHRLIDAHNRYYPIEADLRIEPRSGRYLLAGRAWEPEPRCTPERLVALAKQALEHRS